jgi:hypothetical protein
MSTSDTSREWAPVSGVDVDAINSDLVAGQPTVDVSIYYPSNLDPAHHEKVNVGLLEHGFREAKRVFAEAGVQLKLVSFTTGWLDPRLFAIDSTVSSEELPSLRFVNMYHGAERRPSRPSPDALEAFEVVVGKQPGNDRMVHLVVLQDVFMTFYEQLDFRTWQPKTISTGGLSFPGYMYGATMPRHLRGVITITDLVKSEDSWKTIAHELGHKLMNVSHEYRDVSPQHEVNADGGLMLYGKGTDILSGPEGRYHRERLHASPFVYRETGAGYKEWNSDYSEGGFYYDPIYDGIAVDLD